MTLRIFLAGQKTFGAETFRLVHRLGHDVVGVSAPTGDRPDRLAAAAELERVPVLAAGTLNADKLPPGVDLILCAHSHDFVGRKTRMRVRLGAIGYHPSLLPRHRGRDAVRWTIRMGDAVAGGSVYWLSDRVDAGDIAAQDFVHVAPGETVDSLWRDKLAPLGLRLIETVLGDLDRGVVRRQPQDEAFATWEPAFGAAPLYRPDLTLIGHMPAGFRVERAAARAA